MLCLEDVTSGYGPIGIVRGISLHVDEGEMVSIIGPNGAGKSTLLRTVSGLVRCSSGSIRFCGHEISNAPPHRIAERGLIQVPEGRHLFAPLTVEANLLMGAYSKARIGRARLQALLDSTFDVFPVLRERRKQEAKTLSGGEQQMLAIGRGLMSEPKLLLLDEPSLGLSPIMVKEIARALAQLNGKGLTMLLVEQNAFVALQMAQRAYVIQQGSVALQGEASVLRRDPALTRAYLGKG